MEASGSALMARDQAGPTGPDHASSRSRASWRHPIAAMIVRRTLAGIATLFIASILIFAAVNVLPGDAASVVLGKNATPEAIAKVRADLGLDQPLPSRYADWVTGIISGDLGNSTIAVAQSSPDPAVSSIIGTPMRNSLILAGITALLLIPLSLAFGAYAAVRAGKPSDHAISTVSLTLSSMPEFLVGSLLVVVFFSWLDVLPPISQVPPGGSPFDHPDILVLPIATLLAVSLTFTIRQVRATTIDTLRQDYVAMARLNGYKESRVAQRVAVQDSSASSMRRRPRTNGTPSSRSSSIAVGTSTSWTSPMSTAIGTTSVASTPRSGAGTPRSCTTRPSWRARASEARISEEPEGCRRPEPARMGRAVSHAGQPVARAIQVRLLAGRQRRACALRERRSEPSLGATDST